MNRWLYIASIAVLVVGTTGCLRHNTRCGCNAQGGCPSSGGGLLGKLSSCGCGRTGCVPGPIGWQQGGLNYSSHICPQSGTAGHCGVHGGGMRGGQGMHGGRGGMHGGGGIHGGGQGIRGGQGIHGGGQVITPGPATGAVAYPYYTHRGPRDFLLDNPPSIGR